MQVLKTVPWPKVKVRFLMVEVNHIENGETVVPQLLQQQGFVFIRKIGVDLAFYHNDFAQDLNLL